MSTFKKVGAVMLLAGLWLVPQTVDAAAQALDDDVEIIITMQVGNVIMGWDPNTTGITGGIGDEGNDADWNLGFVALGMLYDNTQTGHVFEVRNYGGGPIDIVTSVSNTNQVPPWTPGAAAGGDVFHLTWRLTTGVARTDVTGAPTELDNGGLSEADMLVGESRVVELQMTTPTADTAGGVHVCTLLMTAKIDDA